MSELNKNNIYFYSIPEKYYTKDYILIDIQILNRTQEILYIFRNTKGKKEFYKSKDKYYYYEYIQSNLSEPTKTLSYNNLNLKFLNKYKDRYDLNPNISYEADINWQVKHSIDYYLTRKEEDQLYNLKILFFDIEINTQGDKNFPKPEDANYPICLISYTLNDELYTLVIDNGKNIDTLNNKVIVFKNEKELIEYFINILKSSSVDIISAWNVGFDILYIYNRMDKLGLDHNSISKYNESYIIPEKNKFHIPGIICLDLLFLYKKFTFQKRENYKLNTIAELELGEKKLEFEGDFANIYDRDINKYIIYNRKDVSLLVNLENKLGFISFLNEIRKTCNGTFESALTSMGQTDSIVTSYLKEKGIASKNLVKTTERGSIPGAWVKEPIPDIYSWFSDFDFSSLYPSLIITYNIGPNTFEFKLVDSELGYEFIYNPDKLPNNIEIIIDPVNNPTKMILSKNKLLKYVKDRNLIITINGCFFKSHKEEISYFSEILDYLLSSRKIYKNKMFEEKQLGNMINFSMYNRKQNSFKVIANTIYGVLSNEYYRFFNLDLGTSVTRSGQEILKNCIYNADKTIDLLKHNKEYNIDKDLLLIDKNDAFTSKDLRLKSPYIITGDTDSIFVLFQTLIENLLLTNEQDIRNKIKEYNTIIGEVLNNKVIPNIVLRHNVELSRNRLNLKNEILARRGLFLAKKRYALHMVEQEGKPMDEIHAMGLEIKRSDFSKITKELLSELISILLKSDNFNLSYLLNFTEEKRNYIIKLIKEGNKYISKPISFAKSINEYKVIPQHLEAMLNWNKLEYSIFEHGSKGYLFTIKGIDYSKAPTSVINKFENEFKNNGKTIKSIAIPEEEEKLPDYYIIDINEMLRFAWEDRWKSLLNPLIQMNETDGIIKF